MPRNHLRAPAAGERRKGGFNEAEARASESQIRVSRPSLANMASMRPRRVPRNHDRDDIVWELPKKLQ